jgi:putative ABC transport system permease protein
MTFEDVFAQAWRAVRGHRQRSALTMLGITIGIASVILLTSIGEGTRVYILNQFTQFGTNLVSINPGRRHPGSARWPARELRSRWPTRRATLRGGRR